MLQNFIFLFDRDLSKLQAELELFQNEAYIWQTTGSIANPAGNLCLHLCGNLNTFIGRELGGTGYVRNRDAEFSTKDVPRQQLVHLIINTRETVTTTLQRMKEEQLAHVYTAHQVVENMTTGFFLIHLHSHLAYHLGQLNYLRRALEGGAAESI